eukprot:PRCOL_00001060-RA
MAVTEAGGGGGNAGATRGAAGGGAGGADAPPRAAGGGVEDTYRAAVALEARGAWAQWLDEDEYRLFRPLLASRRCYGPQAAWRYSLEGATRGQEPAPLPVDDVFYTLDYDADMLDAIAASDAAAAAVGAGASPHEAAGAGAGTGAGAGGGGGDGGVGGGGGSQDAGAPPASAAGGAPAPPGAQPQGATAEGGSDAPMADAKPAAEGGDGSAAAKRKDSPLELVGEGVLRGPVLKDALERILAALTTMGPVAAAFQQPVRVEDAPTYYEVIRAPMDLGTMFRKLQEGCYHTQRDFHADLLLLLRNCQTYNEPKSLVVKYALTVVTKGSKLIHALEKAPEMQGAVLQAHAAARAGEAATQARARAQERVHSDAAGGDRLAELWAERTAESRRVFLLDRAAERERPLEERTAPQRTPQSMGAAMRAATVAMGALGKGVSARNAAPISLEHVAMRDVANWIPDGAWPVPPPPATRPDASQSLQRAPAPMAQCLMGSMSAQASLPRRGSTKAAAAAAAAAAAGIGGSRQKHDNIIAESIAKASEVHDLEAQIETLAAESRKRAGKGSVGKLSSADAAQRQAGARALQGPLADGPRALQARHVPRLAAARLALYYGASGAHGSATDMLVDTLTSVVGRVASCASLLAQQRGVHKHSSKLAWGKVALDAAGLAGAVTNTSGSRAVTIAKLKAYLAVAPGTSAASLRDKKKKLEQRLAAKRSEAKAKAAAAGPRARPHDDTIP